MEGMPEVITVKHIAEYLSISRRRTYELLQLNAEQGGIPFFEVGKSKRVMKVDFIKWIEEQKVKKSS